MRSKAKAFSLLEVLVVVALGMFMTATVMRLYQHTRVVADVKRTADSEAALVNLIRGEFIASPDFSLVNNDVIQTSGHFHYDILTSTSDNRTIAVDGWGNTVLIQPASINAGSDGFSISFIFQNPQKCTNLVPALAEESAQIWIDGQNLQSAPGKAVSGSAVALACAGKLFETGSGVIQFVYFGHVVGSGALASAPACTASCSNQTQTQTVSCPSGQVGEIDQTRTGTCAGSPCPQLTWSAWTTTSSSCAVAPTAPTTTTPSAPTVACSTAVFSRTQSCPTGQVGAITQQQTTTCDASGNPVAGSWKTVANTCATPAPGGGANATTGCTPHVVTATQACPSGQGGEIDTKQNVTCDASGNPVYGAVTQVSNSCQTSCATTGTCCIPSSRDGTQQNVPCGAGEYGQIINQTTAYSTCASATATPVWGTDQVTATSGSCAACPADSTVTQTQTISESAACPTGQTGSDTWQRVQTRSQTTSYACPAGTTALPAPTVSAWTTWTDTGGKISESNTCAVVGTPKISGKECIWAANQTAASEVCAGADVGTPQITGKNGIGAFCSATWTVTLAGESVTGSFDKLYVGYSGSNIITQTVTIAGRDVVVEMAGYWGGTGGDNGPASGACTAITATLE